MNKISIIFRREYLNIVRKKSFLISTILVPLGIAALFGIQIIAALFVEKEDYTVFVLEDETQVITEKLVSGAHFKYKSVAVDNPGDREAISQQIEDLKNQVRESESEIFMSIPREVVTENKGNVTVRLFSSGNLSQQVKRDMRRQLNRAVKKYKEEAAGITKEQLADAQYDLDVQNVKLKGEERTATSEGLAFGMGFGVNFLMYMLIAIYGSILMQGIIEEKTNRIVEVIVSSVRPFQLLLGKTLAIASVGITQLILWGALSAMVLFLLAPLASTIDPADLSAPGVDVEATQSQVEEFLYEIKNTDWTVLWFFPIYFLGGFFLYGSLLAAAGSAVDNIQDAQQFTFPITIPMFLPLLFFSNLLQNPNGVFATVTSQIPFFSPMVMPMRLALTDVPWYEVVLSILILIGAFLGCVWLAARIYRTGILMYGKKPGIKEVLRWVRRS